EIGQVAKALVEIGAELEQLMRTLPSLAAKQSATKEKLDERESLHAFWNQMKSAWKETVQKEWKRGTIAVDHQVMDEAILTEYADKSKTKEKSVLEGELTKLFYNLQPDLTEHKITQYTDAPDMHGWMKEIDREEWKPVIDQWRAKNTRDIIEFDQRGVKISPAALYECVCREL